MTVVAVSEKIAKKNVEISQCKQTIVLNRAMSASVDLPDSKYEMIHLAGAWSRERHVKTRKLEQGIQGIYSMKGISSAEHNPFIALKRPNTDEFNGEVYGFSLIYSGNHIEQVEVDSHNQTRVILGIHPDTFEWPLHEGEEFQTPEAVMVYSDSGMNKMSQTYHRLYRTRLVRGQWRDQVRPILINNWEATDMEFTEEKVLRIAKPGKELGMELFVLDDGWLAAGIMIKLV
ncbi:Melibiase [Bacillus sp. OK048]|nr:Melibiase [Bacillus sp. OK048]